MYLFVRTTSDFRTPTRMRIFLFKHPRVLLIIKGPHVFCDSPAGVSVDSLKSWSLAEFP